MATDLNRLTKDGELPWGWIARNRTFIEPIQKKVSKNIAKWQKTKHGSAQYTQALKKHIGYLRYAEFRCRWKGECHLKWFHDCVASPEYMERWESELESQRKG